MVSEARLPVYGQPNCIYEKHSQLTKLPANLYPHYLSVVHVTEEVVIEANGGQFLLPTLSRSDPVVTQL